MQKYIKNDLSLVRYYEMGVNVGDWIDLNDYRLMTEDEIDRHENPKKYMTDEEKLQLERETMPVLNKVQVELCLFDLDEYDNFQAKLEKNARLRIQFNSTVDFIRLSALTDSLMEVMEKTDLEMDEFWLLASEIDS